MLGYNFCLVVKVWVRIKFGGRVQVSITVRVRGYV